MRIISGLYKGKKILEPKDNKTRPLKDLTKESIFNLIFHSKKFNLEFKNSTILDLFSGVGSFGLECLSRGAKKVTFVENYKEVLPILKRNLINMKLFNNFKIIERNVYENLEFLRNEKFDIIFLDPPFRDKKISELLNKIKEENLLSKNGVIILHRHKKEADILPNQFKIIEEKKYGISKISFFCLLN